MELITITNAVLAALIIGLTQLLKKFVSDKYITLIPPILGVIGAGLTIGWTTPAIFTGIIIGLATEGLYDQKQITA